MYCKHFGVGPEYGPQPRRILWAFYSYSLWHSLTTEPGELFHLRQGLLPGYIGMKLISSRILFEPSGSKAATNNQLSLWLGVELWQLHGSTSGTPALRSFIYWDVGEPTCHPCSTTGMMQDHHFLQLGATWGTFYLRELLCRREEVLSVPRIVFF